MSDPIINQDPKPRNYRISSTNNHVMRLYPALWEQIGLEESIALLQIDYWITNDGFERDEYPGTRWIKMSAATMQARAFGDWSIRKTQRILRRLVRDGYLLSFAFDAPSDATPYYALNDAELNTLDGITLLAGIIQPYFHYVTHMSRGIQAQLSREVDIRRFIAHAGDFQYFPAPYPTMIPWSTYVKTCRFGSRSLSLGYG